MYLRKAAGFANGKDGFRRCVRPPQSIAFAMASEKATSTAK